MKKIFYIHVPKTAGSSFNLLLKDHLNGDVHCEKYFRTGSRQLRYRKRLDDFDFISGHLTISDFRQNQFDRSRYFLVTFLRNPLDQLVSHVNWLIRIHDLGERFFKIHPLHIQALSDQLRAIDLNDAAVLVSVLSDNASLFKNNQSAYFRDESQPDDIESVINNIDGMDFVGITEHYDESVRQFGNLIDFHLPVEIHQENRNPAYRLQKETITGNSDLLAFISEYNAMDYALYEHSIGKFESARL